ncbi:MAG: hypothetical protein AMXMBFR64_54780 [Myxococcales bacterium]
MAPESDTPGAGTCEVCGAALPESGGCPCGAAPGGVPDARAMLGQYALERTGAVPSPGGGAGGRAGGGAAGGGAAGGGAAGGGAAGGGATGGGAAGGGAAGGAAGGGATGGGAAGGATRPIRGGSSPPGGGPTRRAGPAATPGAFRWPGALAALLLIAALAALLHRRSDGVTIVRPPPAACGEPAHSDAWVKTRPAPPSIPCDRVLPISHERNLRDRGSVFTYVGSTLGLDGRHQVYGVFVDVNTGVHQPGERAYVLDRTTAALGWVVKRARTFEENCLSMDLIPTQDAVEIGLIVTAGYAPRLAVETAEEDIARALRAADPLLDPGADTLRAIWQSAMDVHGATSVSFLFYVPWQGRSYATNRPDYDYTVLFTPPEELTPEEAPRLEKMFAHEFYHLAGSDDLYNIRQAATWEVRSLMNIGCLSLAEAQVDPFSDFAAGLGRGYDPDESPPATPFPVDDKRGKFQRLRP